MSEFDVLIVPGARVYADGGLSPAFKRRLDRAAARYADGVAPRVLVSGRGHGGRTEAEAGTAHLAASGVPQEALILEPRAANTRENAAFAAALVQGRVLVVTCELHARRCRWVFASHFTSVVVEGVPGPGGLKPRLREGLSTLRYLLGG